MPNDFLQAEVKLKAEFYDIDSLKVVWHGNYVKYLELARSALLDSIGYNYAEMEKSGFAWPIVSLQMKFVKPICCGQVFFVRALLMEYENRIKISYRMSDAASGEILNSAETIQMAVDGATGKSLFVSPPCLIRSD